MSKLTVIDFYADWCGPCKYIKPYFQDLERRYGDEVEFKTIDVDDDEDDLSMKYNITAMPTFIFIKDGKEVARIRGAKKEELIKKVVELK